MGVKHLKSFLEKSVEGGKIPVSLRNECEEFQRKNNAKPILVFDFLALPNVIVKNEIDMLYGGRHQEYYNQIDKVFKELSEIAELVFIKDGPLKRKKSDRSLGALDKKGYQYKDILGVIDKVNRGIPIAAIVRKSKNIKRVASNHRAVEDRAAFYGTLIVAFTNNCDAEVAKFSTDNTRVIGVLTDDTDFLIFPGNWRVFSIDKLNNETLKTVEYSRSALKRHLNLDDKQLAVFSTISGNDIMKYEDVRHCHGKQKGFHSKFETIADFIRENINVNDPQQMYQKVAEYIKSSSNELVRESIDQYKIDFLVPEEQDELLRFCRQRDFNTVYSILHNVPMEVKLSYVDIRNNAFYNPGHDCYDCSDFIASSVKLLRRSAGIILQHRRPEDGDIEIEYQAKVSMAEHFKFHSTNPEYPSDAVPPLIEFLDRETYPNHDEIRYKLFKWAISDSLANKELSHIPVDYFMTIITIYRMIRELRYMTVEEGDLILLSCKDVGNISRNIFPEPLIRPEFVTKRAFRIAMLFSQEFNISVGRILGITGLQHKNTLNKFDGALFHKLYMDYKYKKFDPTPLLDDIKQYRIYEYSIEILDNAILEE